MPATDYVCLKELGKGSFGRVFLVRHVTENTKWVMKEIDVSGNADPEKARRDAIKEVNMLSRLDHPNIVKYRECFQTSTVITPSTTGEELAAVPPDANPRSSLMYIIMEYADSGDLNARIRVQRKPFSEQQIVDWFVQLCLAVKHLHDRKCLHRDLKGENVFLSSGDRIKLGDFGISTVLANTMACANTRIGTPYYLSPEICMNKAYNASSDMWSLGVCLYELCMLSHPFDASSMESLLKKIVRQPHRSIHPFYHPELRVLVDALLQKSASKRPSIHEVLRTPIVQREISKWLTKAEYEREFLAFPSRVQIYPNVFSPSLISTPTKLETQPTIGVTAVVSNSKEKEKTDQTRQPGSAQKTKTKTRDNETAKWLKNAEDLMKIAEDKRRLAQQQRTPARPVSTVEQNSDSLSQKLKELEREQREEESKELSQQKGMPLVPSSRPAINQFVLGKPSPVLVACIGGLSSLPPSPSHRSNKSNITAQNALFQISQPPSPTHRPSDHTRTPSGGPRPMKV